MGRRSKAARATARHPLGRASKVDMINAAEAERSDLTAWQPLGALRGSLKGYHSIRVNDQWRIVFAGTLVRYTGSHHDYHS